MAGIDMWLSMLRFSGGAQRRPRQPMLPISSSGFALVAKKRALNRNTRGRWCIGRSLRGRFVLRFLEKLLRVSTRGSVIEGTARPFQGINRQLAYADAMAVFAPFPKLDDLDV